MTKIELRKNYKEKRKQLSVDELIQLDSLLLIRFQQLVLGEVNSVLSFWPIEEMAEVNTHLMTDYLLFTRPALQVAYPVMSFTNNIFTPILVNEDTVYKTNKYGISEPQSGLEILPVEIDLVFVPLLAFDEKGFRVGYGKGFYDRFLQTCRQDVIKLGFSYFDPVPAISDINVFDVPLNICITPNKIYEF